MRSEERVALALCLAGFALAATGVQSGLYVVLLLLVVLVVRQLAAAWLDEWSRARVAFLVMLGAVVFVATVVRRVAEILA